ncbi:Hypothetical protein CINCED_3A013187 [Cinara cedri]|uniref:Uncharacterized protein n=1 Tax=Cinara cedri TaxID=506608 RepID=A0A5E4NG15_9HEMI|nr:Hypothetical protein CINCED_3A013187 [Cinara cedri]
MSKPKEEKKAGAYSVALEEPAVFSTMKCGGPLMFFGENGNSGTQRNYRSVVVGLAEGKGPEKTIKNNEVFYKTFFFHGILSYASIVFSRQYLLQFIPGGLISTAQATTITSARAAAAVSASSSVAVPFNWTIQSDANQKPSRDRRAVAETDFSSSARPCYKVRPRRLPLMPALPLRRPPCNSVSDVAQR